MSDLTQQEIEDNSKALRIVENINSESIARNVIRYLQGKFLIQGSFLYTEDILKILEEANINDKKFIVREINTIIRDMQWEVEDKVREILYVVAEATAKYENEDDE